MSFDIPPRIEPSIQEFAHAEHITADEAVVRLIEAGLKASQRRHTVKTKSNSLIPGLTGQPMSDEEAAVMDEVVEAAMQSRSIRWAGSLSA